MIPKSIIIRLPRPQYPQCGRAHDLLRLVSRCEFWTQWK